MTTAPDFSTKTVQEQPSKPELDSRKISDLFGEHVFDLNTLKESVTDDTYQVIRGVVLKQQKIQFETAKEIAAAMIRWAMGKGATHFTHWFQPLTDSAAEKHDSFFNPSVDLEEQGIENLSASDLIKREPDGSSFPSGGLRETHAARGYSIWDPSSPAFILETEHGKTLYIPAIFISYTGESLDYKTPLLKANHALNEAATSVCQLFDEEITHVFSTLGWEQEYFLVDEQFFNSRPDLLLAGRTIFGGRSEKGQQMDDHYFGSIPERVQDFMKDFEQRALKLGIPIITRHNEVAPGQFECAPMFEESNIAVDHNQLIRDLMAKVAIRHGFRILFDEKPFAGLNGSGKHCNWSMCTSNGKNLLSLGEAPRSKLQFLTFFVNILKAIHDHNDLLRASIASAGNDHRLGANEAPPAIISVFIGSHLDRILDRFSASGLSNESNDHAEVIDLGLTKIPDIERDLTDRNRTSPFPFTDNRFEFRAVGASANCAAPITVINTIVADQLQSFKHEVDQLSKKNGDVNASIVHVLQSYMEDVRRIVFNGNGYSEAWEQEAANRGLSNNRNTPAALASMLTANSKGLFERQNIFSGRELESRYKVLLEKYIHKVGIEAELFQTMSRNHVLPAAYKTINQLAETFQNLRQMGLDSQGLDLEEQVKTISVACKQLNDNLLQLKEIYDSANGMSDLTEIAKTYAEQIKPFLDVVRENIDALEGLVDDHHWELPKYRELLFIGKA